MVNYNQDCSCTLLLLLQLELGMLLAIQLLTHCHVHSVAIDSHAQCIGASFGGFERAQAVGQLHLL